MQFSRGGGASNESEIVVERVVNRDIRYLSRENALVEQGPDGIVNVNGLILLFVVAITHCSAMLF